MGQLVLQGRCSAGMVGLQSPRGGSPRTIVSSSDWPRPLEGAPGAYVAHSRLISSGVRARD
jgi:hypothetical protein